MENDRTATLLARLVKTSKQGRDIFNEAAAKSEDGLRFLFHAISEQHQQFLEDLTPLSTSAALEQDPDSSRQWAPTVGVRRLSAEAAINEHTLVSRCAEAENEAVMEYQAAIDTTNLPESTLEMVQRHLRSMKAARNYLRGLGAF